MSGRAQLQNDTGQKYRHHRTMTHTPYVTPHDCAVKLVNWLLNLSRKFRLYMEIHHAKVTLISIFLLFLIYKDHIQHLSQVLAYS